MSNGTSTTNENLGIHGLEIVSLVIEACLLITLFILTWGFKYMECHRMRRIKPNASEGGAWMRAFHIVGSRTPCSHFFVLAIRIAALTLVVVTIAVFYPREYKDGGGDFRVFISYLSNLNFIASGLYYFFAICVHLLYAIWYCTASSSRRGDPPSANTYRGAALLKPLTVTMEFIFALKLASSLIIFVVYWGSFLVVFLGYPVEHRSSPSIGGFLTLGGDTLFLLIEFGFVNSALYFSDAFVSAMVPVFYFWYVLFGTSTGIFLFYPFQAFVDPEAPNALPYLPNVIIRLIASMAWFLIFVICWVAWIIKQCIVRRACTYTAPMPSMKDELAFVTLNENDTDSVLWSADGN